MFHTVSRGYLEFRQCKPSHNDRGERWGYLVVGYENRGLESREGGLIYHACQGSFWFRQYPRDGHGTFLFCDEAPQIHM